jgi:hypothetical protein
MSNEMQVDIVIGSTQAHSVDPIEEQLSPLNPTRADAVREPVTILAVTAGVIALTKSLVELWQTLHAKHEPAQAPVTIEVESGAILQLGDVKSAAEIERFIATHSPASPGSAT